MIDEPATIRALKNAGFRTSQINHQGWYENYGNQIHLDQVKKIIEEYMKESN